MCKRYLVLIFALFCNIEVRSQNKTISYCKIAEIKSIIDSINLSIDQEIDMFEYSLDTNEYFSWCFYQFQKGRLIYFPDYQDSAFLIKVRLSHDSLGRINRFAIEGSCFMEGYSKKYYKYHKKQYYRILNDLKTCKLEKYWEFEYFFEVAFFDIELIKRPPIKL